MSSNAYIGETGGITGMIVFDCERFIQVLEGQHEQIATLRRIKHVEAKRAPASTQVVKRNQSPLPTSSIVFRR